MKKKLLVFFILTALYLTGFAQESADSTDTEDPDLYSDPFGSMEESDEDLFTDPFSEEEAEDAETEDPDLFSDPFADSGENTSDQKTEGEEIDASLDDFDSLFSDDMIEEVEEDANAPDLADELLKDEGVRWSGKYSGRIDLGFKWDDYWNKSIFREADSDSLVPEVSGTLRFNARPDTEYRVSGKLSISGAGSFDFGSLGINPADFSTSTDADGNLLITNNAEEEEEDSEPEEEPVPDQNQVTFTIGVEELFADFNWDRTLFFRFGKSFIKWGKGYFWSPADIVNLGSIDAEDPTAERQGPVNLKINYPFQQNNLYLYLLLDGAAVPEHLGIAFNAEFVIGKFEIGAGVYYKYEQAPRIAAVFSGSIGKIGVFGEGVVSFGSDRVFVRESKIQPVFEEPADGEDPPETYVTLDTFTINWLPIFSGTIGAMYMNNEINMNIIGQYFFNGDGYADKRFGDGSSLLENAMYLLNNADSNGLALPDDQQGDNYEEPPALGNSDIMNFGQHYLGISISFSEMFDTDLGFSLFWLGNLSDWSGIISPSLSYKLFDKASVSLSARMTYGQKGDELMNPQALFAADEDNSPQVPTFDLTLSFSLGGGNF